MERKRQAILAQRKATTVQATMRFQRNMPGFTVMGQLVFSLKLDRVLFYSIDPNKFDQAIETITGRQVSNRSTPRRPNAMQQQRFKDNTTFRRSISMEDLRSRQPTSNPPRMDHRNQQIFTRTNSVSQIPQYQNQLQYTSPLHEVQRRVLDDFAAEIHSTLTQPQSQHHPQFDEGNTWEYESVDSLEASNQFHPQQITSTPKITGPIVRPNHPVNIQSRKINHSPLESTGVTDQHELLQRSYHESFFVKNTPVTGDEQVSAWLGATKNATTSDITDADSEANAKRKSILKRSPSVESNTPHPIIIPRKNSVPQARTVGDKARVKDSLEVINAKLLKELDIQVKQQL